MPQALYCRRHTAESRVDVHYTYMKYTCYVEVSVSKWNRCNCSYQVYPMILPLVFPTCGGCEVSSFDATNVGLVALILLGWELHASYITQGCHKYFSICPDTASKNPKICPTKNPDMNIFRIPTKKTR